MSNKSITIARIVLNSDSYAYKAAGIWGGSPKDYEASILVAEFKDTSDLVNALWQGRSKGWTRLRNVIFREAERGISYKKAKSAAAAMVGRRGFVLTPANDNDVLFWEELNRLVPTSTVLEGVPMFDRSKVAKKVLAWRPDMTKQAPYLRRVFADLVSHVRSREDMYIAILQIAAQYREVLSMRDAKFIVSMLKEATDENWRDDMSRILGFIYMHLFAIYERSSK